MTKGHFQAPEPQGAAAGQVILRDGRVATQRPAREGDRALLPKELLEPEALDLSVRAGGPGQGAGVLKARISVAVPAETVAETDA